MLPIKIMRMRNAGVSPVLWTPASLTTPPYMWWNDDSSVTAVSGAASQWNDISGNGDHLLQTDSSKYPVINAAALNGRRTLSFTAGANAKRMETGTTHARDVFRAQSAGWALAVFKRLSTDGSPAARSLLVSTNGTDGSSRFVAAAAQGTANAPALLTRRLDGDATSVLDGTDTVTSGFRVVLWIMDWGNADAFVYVDGALDVSNTSAGSAGSTDNTASQRYIYVGGYPTGPGTSQPIVNHCDMELAELIVGRATFAAGEIDKLNGYAHHRWGLAANLDVSHPYKTTAPTV